MRADCLPGRHPRFAPKVHVPEPPDRVQSWHILLSRHEVECGFAQVTEYHSTSRLLGREHGPMLVLDWLEVFKVAPIDGIHPGRVRSLFAEVLRFSYERTLDSGVTALIFEAGRPSVDRYFTRSVKLPIGGVPPQTYFVVNAARLRVLYEDYR